MLILYGVAPFARDSGIEGRSANLVSRKASIQDGRRLDLVSRWSWPSSRHYGHLGSGSGWGRAWPHDDARRYHEMLRFRSSLDPLDQQARCLKPQLLPRLIDARQAVLSEVAEHGVVVADHGQVIRDVEAEFPGNADHLKGDQIGPAEDGIGALWARQQAAGA